MTTSHGAVRYEESGPIARLVLDDAPRRNALSAAICRAICQSLSRAQDDERIRVILITGEPPAFCSGGDIKTMAARKDIFGGEDSLALTESYRETIQRIPRTLMQIDKPVIALVDGAAIGAGCDLACFCDLRIATTRARFAESFGRLGLISGIGGAFALVRLTGMGYAAAADLALAGRVVEAAEAFDLGLVNRLCAPDDLEDVARSLCEAIIDQPARAVAGTKRLLRQALGGALDDHLGFAAALQGSLHFSDEHRNRVAKALSRTT